MRIGFSALIVPLHQPLRLAEEVATLDQISGGRVNFGISRGHGGNYFECFGIDAAQRTQLFRDNLSEILNYWKNGTIQMGETELGFSPRPVQLSGPPIYVAAYSDESVKWVAESGYHLLLHGIQSIDSLRRCLHIYKQSGGAVDSVPVGRFVYVGENDEQAREEIWPTLLDISAVFKRIRTERFAQINSEQDIEPEGLLRQLAIIGGPETRAMKIAQLREELGIQHLNLLPSFFGLLPGRLLEQSLVRFSQEVMPRLK
ncbi:LLM class flavin-dependent oxidoreductase [Ammoniphilus oxalaticus]|uniref:LLM class flavin-dependent oxidoreductase n=1 Tax=Ammoniphilus oxalaticus TaxID=66863 RepID=UPI000E716246|nr:LLM class flavin-dependent oxidoreductase [Ammoniphilus oxalaticus]